MTNLLVASSAILRTGLSKRAVYKRHIAGLFGCVLENNPSHRFSRSFSTPQAYTFEKPNGKRTKSTSLLSYGIAAASGLSLYFWLYSQSCALDVIEFQDSEKTDPATSIKFPMNLQIDGEPTMTLLGVGVRTVSFLGIRVYSVGFYADLSGINIMSLRTCKDAGEGIETILKTTTCALRIVPTRATSYSHLRDGFIRAIQSRQLLARKAGILEAEQEETLHEPLQKFKGLFPTAAFKKHEPLHIVLSSPKKNPRQLRIPPLGTVKDTWIATEFFRAYFQGTISPPLIEDVKQGVDGIRLEARL